MQADRAAVFRALVDPALVARWRFPAGMRCEVHEWQAQVGGTCRVSLTYVDADGAGKTSSRTDTYRGRFERIEPAVEVVERIGFETDDPAFGGEMLVATTLRDVDGGTEVVIAHDGLPAGVSVEDNAAGTAMALENLARLVERPVTPST